MERNFALPVIVAAAAHGALFLACGGPRQHAAIPEPPPVVLWDGGVVPPSEPEESFVTDVEGTRSSSNPPPMRIPDRPHPRVDPASFRQEVDDSSRIVVPDPSIDRISRSWTADAANAMRSGGPVPIVSLDNKPAARFQPAPIYPGELRASGEEGRATVEFSVDTTGKVFNATLIAADHPAFGAEVLRAVNKWRFEPGVKGNKRVPFRMAQTFTFNLSR